MKKTIMSLCILASLFASCSKESTQRQLTKDEIKQKVDSIMAVRNAQMEDAGKTDLKHRLKIEVKVKADSIMNAHYTEKKSPSADTLKGKHK